MTKAIVELIGSMSRIITSIIDHKYTPQQIEGITGWTILFIVAIMGGIILRAKIKRSLKFHDRTKYQS